jgi:outer membrane protein assembly factor BamB
VYVAARGITRFHRDSLKPVWRTFTEATAFEPVATAEVILVANTRGLYALDPATGGQRWQLKSEEALLPPAVAGGIAFTSGADGSLRAIALDSGRVIWRRDFGGWLYTPAVIGELLVVGGREGILRAIDAREGHALWQKGLVQELVYRPIPVPGARVIVTLFNGDIMLVDAKDGNTRWQVHDDTPSFPPAQSGGRLFFGTFGGRLKARSLEDGHVLWEQTLGGRLRFLPHVVGDVVLVATDAGGIGAYDVDSGQRVWHRSTARALVGSPVMLKGAIVVFTADGKALSWPAPFATGRQR